MKKVVCKIKRSNGGHDNAIYVFSFWRQHRLRFTFNCKLNYSAQLYVEIHFLVNLQVEVEQKSSTNSWRENAPLGRVLLSLLRNLICWVSSAKASTTLQQYNACSLQLVSLSSSSCTSSPAYQRRTHFSQLVVRDNRIQQRREGFGFLLLKFLYSVSPRAPDKHISPYIHFTYWTVTVFGVLWFHSGIFASCAVYRKSRLTDWPSLWFWCQLYLFFLFPYRTCFVSFGQAPISFYKILPTP